MLVRFFYKEGLSNIKGTVLELGCGNGCNLQLFSEYGYKVLGIDFDNQIISDSKHNFLLSNRRDYEFVQYDIYTYLCTSKEIFDVILIPAVLYYLPTEDILKILDLLLLKAKKGSYFYFNMRSIHDYRFQHGLKISDNEVEINFKETGEYGCHMSFWESEDFKEIIIKKWHPSKIVLLNNYLKFRK
jgi:SAM-dependent methyltransferase